MDFSKALGRTEQNSYLNLTDSVSTRPKSKSLAKKVPQPFSPYPNTPPKSLAKRKIDLNRTAPLISLPQNGRVQNKKGSDALAKTTHFRPGSRRESLGLMKERTTIRSLSMPAKIGYDSQVRGEAKKPLSKKEKERLDRLGSKTLKVIHGGRKKGSSLLTEDSSSLNVVAKPTEAPLVDKPDILDPYNESKEDEGKTALPDLVIHAQRSVASAQLDETQRIEEEAVLAKVMNYIVLELSKKGVEGLSDLSPMEVLKLLQTNPHAASSIVKLDLTQMQKLPLSLKEIRFPSVTYVTCSRSLFWEYAHLFKTIFPKIQILCFRDSPLVRPV